MNKTDNSKGFNSAIDDFLKHQAQIPLIAEYYLEFREIIECINVSTHENIKYMIQRIQYMYYLERIMELNFSLQNSLTLGQYSTVEALSRVALETSVNLLYLLDEKENERAMGLIHGHIKKNLYKAKKWNEHAKEINYEVAIEMSEKLRQKMEFGQKFFISSSGRKPQQWPDSIKKKFKEVGLEEAYLTVFASSSGSVHLGAEDIYNRTLVEFSDKSAQEEFAEGVIAEQTSFAIYLTLCSFLHALQAIKKLANKLEDKPIISRANKLIEKFYELKEVHELDHIEAY